MIRMAFMGFRHGHIFALYEQAKQHSGVEIVAACEEDAATRADLAKGGKIAITHDSFDRMLRQVRCDAVAVGDYYGRRGAILIECLKRGLHVIADKPICTRMDELTQIESLAAAKRLSVGCQLDLRDSGLFQRVRELVLGGRIGEVHGIAFGGQHPLYRGVRPGWYFEEGKHGGTINDIGIHAFDAIPWMTGLRFAEVVCARSWNAFAPDLPFLRDAGQFMLRMENGCGVLGDVSYFMPDSMGYSMPQYWRMTLFGRNGVIETSPKMGVVALAVNGSKQIEEFPALAGTPGGYLDSFVREIGGETTGLSPSSRDVLRASRISLAVQEAGDSGSAHVALPLA